MNLAILTTKACLRSHTTLIHSRPFSTLYLPNNNSYVVKELRQYVSKGAFPSRIVRALILCILPPVKVIKIVSELLSLPDTNVNALTREHKTAFDIAEGLTLCEETSLIKETLARYGGGRNQQRHSVTVVVFLFATVAFDAIFTVPRGDDDSGMAVMVNTTSFKIFFILNAIALFTSLAVVLVQITVVRGETKAERRVIEVINKLMWCAYYVVKSKRFRKVRKKEKRVGGSHHCHHHHSDSETEVNSIYAI
ncbi:hypothetical protein F8388_010470 [Cannabis sativa]|uniref:PGG domain-containing protein n=1 Tax=Cannabis sativa TaxID=3483 RepID=A0A7J6GSK1_CANSA|nr:hypothetical protein F8388_010470 [Cannabis sativa]